MRTGAVRAKGPATSRGTTLMARLARAQVAAAVSAPAAVASSFHCILYREPHDFCTFVTCCPCFIVHPWHRIAPLAPGGAARGGVHPHGHGPHLRHGAGRPGGRGHQGRARGGRPHPPPARCGRGLLSHVQPQQEEHRARPAPPRGAGGGAWRGHPRAPLGAARGGLARRRGASAGRPMRALRGRGGAAGRGGVVAGQGLRGYSREGGDVRAGSRLAGSGGWVGLSGGLRRKRGRTFRHDTLGQFSTAPRATAESLRRPSLGGSDRAPRCLRRTAQTFRATSCFPPSSR